QTIVATALPRITAEFGDMSHYAWVTTAYLLSSTIMVPIAARLSDQLGRKPLLLGGSLAFLVTSLMCAQAQDFSQLIGARVLQGIGGGAITAAVFATVPTLFSPQGRARIVGLFTGTYGLASIVGPLVGGIVTDVISWRGVFYLNVPLGLVALALLAFAYRPYAVTSRKPRIDYLGAVTLVGGLLPLLLALSLGGRDLAWTSPAMLLLVCTSVVVFVLFARIETRASEPILPFSLVRDRGVGIPTLGMLFLSGGLFANALFTPLFVQGVIGSSATRSGSISAPMMIAFVAGSILIGQLIARVPRYRAIGVLGLLGAAIGEWLMSGMGLDTDYATVSRNLAIVGFGLGGALSAFAIASQNAVPIAQMGVATGLGASGRAIGSTLASAGFGSLLTARIGAEAPSPQVLAAALHDTFLAAVLVLVIGAVLVVPLKEAPLRQFGASARYERPGATA
ncbi:MAG: MFS transporter, partial [Chloroflexi bacterium]|nr:MFS transporter [Chloroflexota bacterium]